MSPATLISSLEGSFCMEQELSETNISHVVHALHSVSVIQRKFIMNGNIWNDSYFEQEINNYMEVEKDPHRCINNLSHWKGKRVVQYSNKFMHGIVHLYITLSSHYNTVQKLNNWWRTKQNKTMRNLTEPCIDLLEYWTRPVWKEPEKIQAWLGIKPDLFVMTGHSAQFIKPTIERAIMSL